MANKRIEGYATLTLQVEKQTDTLILDTRALDIVSVEGLPGSTGGGAPAGTCRRLQFSLGEAHTVLGQPLHISLGPGPAPPKVGIHFRVTSESSAVQFLTPEQTVGKQHAYLFTQCQVKARS
jgi:leukotriene-A4 hydrolase